MIDTLQAWLFDPVTGKILATGLALLVGVALVKTGQRALNRYVDNQERRYRLRKLITFGGYLVTAFLISLVFSDRLGGLTVFFGVAGAGIAFALQEVITSVAGWVTMSFGNIYQVGDRIQLGGIKGDVIDIGMLRTTLMECGGWIDGDQYNGRIVRVANSFVFKEPVFNYSSDFPFLWDELLVPVHFGSDYALAHSAFEEVLEEVTGDLAKRLQGQWRAMTERYVLEDARLAPMVTMTIRSDWVEFALRYVVDYKQRRSTKDKISAGVLAAIDGSNGAMALGSSSLELSTIAPLQVSLDPR